MSEDEWLKAALTEPSLVANLLLQISHSKKALHKKSQTQTPHLTWRVRQPRSKATPKFDSPNTPFLLSDRATSSSHNCFEDATSSLPVAKTKRCNKGGDASEKKTNKRSRKKKTLSELKEDEVLVLKERRDLEKKLASLHVTFEKERARNDRLKRLMLEYVRAAKKVKLPVHAEESAKMVSSYDPLSVVSKICASKPVEQLNLSNPPKPNRENQFMLPDLNLSIEDRNS